jgi:hypothetical protein
MTRPRSLVGVAGEITSSGSPSLHAATLRGYVIYSRARARKRDATTYVTFFLWDRNVAGAQPVLMAYGRLLTLFMW